MESLPPYPCTWDNSDSDSSEPYTTASSSDEELTTTTSTTPPLPLIDAQTLVMVRGRYYDFTHFAHPGGRLVLQQGRGSDLTAAVASHHFTEAPYRVMKQYEIPFERVTGAIASGGYSFKQDGFHNVLKQRIVQQIAGGDALKMRSLSQPSNWYVARCVAVFSLYLASWAWCCFGPFFSYVACAVAMLTRTTLVGIGHEAIHGRLSAPLFYLFGLVLCFPSERWHYDHVVLHHPHTKR